MKRYYSRGKLLLTGEYVVLDGALALAIPTQFGQSLSVEEIDEPKLIWTSLDDNQDLWLEAHFEINEGQIIRLNESKNEIVNRLENILHTAQQLNPNFLKSGNGYKVTTHLEFPKHWGLGTSSTLINNIAQWAKVSPYILLERTFGGSGYDIASASSTTAISYQLDLKNKERNIKQVTFNPNFKKHLYFVHLNKKQNSREGIAHYEKNKSALSETISNIDYITKKIITCKTLNEFCSLINTHEQIISKITNQRPIQEVVFSDFKGSIKSLGAWGGDFVLVASTSNPKAYFEEKGYKTILDFNTMVL